MSKHPDAAGAAKMNDPVKSAYKKRFRLDALTPICQLITYILLVMAVLFLVYFGIHLFSRITQERNRMEHKRASVVYVQNQVALCGDPAGVYIADGPEGDMLCLPLEMYREADSASSNRFEVKLYLFDGYLREELSLMGASPDPEEAEKIEAASGFNVWFEGERLLVFEIDGIRGMAALREAAYE